MQSKKPTNRYSVKIKSKYAQIQRKYRRMKNPPESGGFSFALTSLFDFILEMLGSQRNALFTKHFP